MSEHNEVIMKAEGLVKHFPASTSFMEDFASILRKKSRVIRVVHALDGVSFELRTGETLGIVGESGCGKTTLGRIILRLTDPTAGRVIFKGKDITKFKKKEMRKIYADMQVVFQDPTSSLDPRMRVMKIVAEPLRTRVKNKSEIASRVNEVFQTVGLNREYLARFPHEFSGGQRQRIAVARAIITKPSLLVLDEPTSSLDASIRAQVLDLLVDLQCEFGLTYVFISHDINVVYHISDRIAVMYLGKFVEVGPADTIVIKPRHPYSVALISAVPKPNPRARSKLVQVKGEVPSSINPPHGCRYHPRCPHAKDKCVAEEPKLEELEQGHFVACFYPF
ncbi:MAG: ABC transporter ATP-binding protein [Candidatus Bathyarchaeia archaeon]